MIRLALVLLTVGGFRVQEWVGGGGGISRVPILPARVVSGIPDLPGFTELTAAPGHGDVVPDIPDLPDWISDPIGWLIEQLVNLITSVIGALIEFMLWLFIKTPAPNSAVTADVSTDNSSSNLNGTNQTLLAEGGNTTNTTNASIFATPPQGETYRQFYMVQQDMVLIAILVLLTFWVLTFAVAGFTSFLAQYDQSHVNRRVFLAGLLIYGWWPIHTAATNFANALAIAIAPSNLGAFTSNITGTVLTALSGTFIGLVLASVSLPAFLAAILVYVIRMFVIYVFSFAMPLLIALWAVDVGVFKQVSQIGGKFMKVYAPAVFFTLPAAVLLRAAQIFITSPIEGLGSAALSLFAITLPVLAIIAPKMMFDELMEFTPSGKDIRRKTGVGAKNPAKSSSSRRSQSGGASGNGQSATGGQSSGGGAGRRPVRPRQTFSKNRALNRASKAKRAAGTPVRKAKQVSGGQTKTQRRFGTAKADYENRGVGGYSITETAQRMTSGDPSPQFGDSGSDPTVDQPRNVRELLDKSQEDGYDWGNARFGADPSETDLAPEEVPVYHVADDEEAKEKAKESDAAAAWIGDDWGDTAS